MSQFQLFESVKLKEAIPLSEEGSAPEGTPGAITDTPKQALVCKQECPIAPQFLP